MWIFQKVMVRGIWINLNSNDDKSWVKVTQIIAWISDVILTLKEPGGGIHPLDIFCYISAGCYFFALKLHDFFPSSLALYLRPFFKKIGPRVMTRRCVIEHWVQRKTDQQTDFQWKLHTNRVFCFQDTLSLCFILFIWFIWSKNMCKHTLTHIIAKKCNFCLKK